MKERANLYIENPHTHARTPARSPAPLPHARQHARIHSHTHTRAHTHTHTYTHTHTLSHTHTHTPHARTVTHARTHAHTHTHTHTLKFRTNPPLFPKNNVPKESVSSQCILKSATDTVNYKALHAPLVAQRQIRVHTCDDHKTGVGQHPLQSDTFVVKLLRRAS